MKKNCKVLICLMQVVLILLLAAAPTAAAPALNRTTAAVTWHRKIQLKVTGTASTVKWTSSDPRIAEVDSGGYVYGVKTGNAVITAAVAGKKLQCRVTVRRNVANTGVKPTNIDLSGSTRLTFHPQILSYKSGDLIVKGFFANKTAKTCYALKNCRITIYGTRGGKRYTLGSSVFTGKLSVKPGVARYVTMTFKGAVKKTKAYDLPMMKNIVSSRITGIDWTGSTLK